MARQLSIMGMSAAWSVLSFLPWLSAVGAVRVSNNVTLEAHDVSNRSAATSQENVTGDWVFQFKPYEDYVPHYSEYYSHEEDIPRCDPDVCRWLSDCYRHSHDCRDCEGCPRHHQDYTYSAAATFGKPLPGGVRSGLRKPHKPSAGKAT
mmetsp:Transcript_39586/g.88613  ORF Transcript_39586/g.88613 Transcript_39586/m.88613 type:complete len:149 (+) Transcript_39586:76-522(+)